MLTNCLAACTHLSKTVSQLFEPQVQKIAVFTYRSPHFCFPRRRPCDYHAICCMDGKTIQCLPKSSQHVPIYVQYSFRLIRCLNQCVSPKIAIFTTFLFPLYGDAPGAITLNSMLTNCLAACAHLTISVSEIERDICGKKSSFYRTLLHSTPPLGGLPSGYRHPLWYGKTRIVSLPDGE